MIESCTSGLLWDHYMCLGKVTDAYSFCKLSCRLLCALKLPVVLHAISGVSANGASSANMQAHSNLLRHCMHSSCAVAKSTIALCKCKHVLSPISVLAHCTSGYRQHLCACIRHLCLERQSSQVWVLPEVDQHLRVQPTHVLCATG